MTETTGIILTAAVVGLIAAAAATILSRARKAGLALHRQLDAVLEETGKIRADHNLWAQRLQDGQAASATQNTIQEEILRSTRAEVSHAHRILQDLDGRVQQDLHALDARVHDNLKALDSRMATFSSATMQAFETLIRKPAQPLFLDPALTNERTEQELTALAQSIAILRPLIPYPKWRTDAELQNPDLSYQLRRWFWQFFHDRRRDAPILVRWHDETQLRLFLGNDVSAQIYIAGCWEPNEFAFLDRILRPGMTFLDAGANDGVYTVFAAKRVGSGGTVWAFEPSRRELDRLRFNMDLNGLPVRVFPVALAEVNGEAELTVGGYEHEGHNTLGAFAYSGVEMERKEAVELRRLDDIITENPPARLDVIKLDVEGAECRLLKGAISTLERYRPIVMFEVSETSLRNQGSSGADLLAILRDQRYVLNAYDPGTGLVAPVTEGTRSDNMVAVPEERPLPPAVRMPWPVLAGHSTAY